MSIDKTCTICGQTKSLDSFGKRTKSPDGKQYGCLDCQRQKMRNHYNDNKQYYATKAANRNAKMLETNRNHVIQYFSEHSCIDCGLDDIRCLQFDHVRGTKKYNVSEMMRWCSLSALIEEISKCEVRCANCHVIKTGSEFSWWSHNFDQSSVYPHATNV